MPTISLGGSSSRWAAAISAVARVENPIGVSTLSARGSEISDSLIFFTGDQTGQLYVEIQEADLSFRKIIIDHDVTPLMSLIPSDLLTTRIITIIPLSN